MQLVEIIKAKILLLKLWQKAYDYVQQIGKIDYLNDKPVVSSPVVC